MRNIVFIGMPGAGKSTIGVVIAKIFGYSFVDADIKIQEREGDILEHLIEKNGIEGFLAIENDVNLHIEGERMVISTGGSACYCEEAMRHYKEHDLVVYLQLDLPEIQQRVGSLAKRGVVIHKGNTLRDLYEERTPLYEKYADITVDLTGCQIHDSVKRTEKAIRACSKLYE